jgi:hypothetical protein
MPLTDIENARHLFREAGLAFPTIPADLAARLKERDTWLFSTRDVDVSPYLLQHYIKEADEAAGEDYAILSHSGHGVNSYALQYYLVYGALRMFLHLGWGGAYMDATADAAKIGKCFLLADEIIAAGQNSEKFRAAGRLTIVCSDPRTDAFVVIELKKGRESDKVVGQVLRYMGWVAENLGEPGQEVRGIVICKAPDDRLLFALKMLRNVSVKYYRVDFKLQDEP